MGRFLSICLLLALEMFVSGEDEQPFDEDLFKQINSGYRPFDPVNCMSAGEKGLEIKTSDFPTDYKLVEGTDVGNEAPDEHFMEETCGFYRVFHNLVCRVNRDPDKKPNNLFDFRHSWIMVDHMLITRPPTTSIDNPTLSPDQINVEVKQVDLTKYWQSEWLGQVFINGFLILEWMDKRLSWESVEKTCGTCYRPYTKTGKKNGTLLCSDMAYQQVKADSIKILDPMYWFWFPDIASQKWWWFYSKPEQRKTSISKKGLVRTHLQFKVNEECPMSFDDFPNDVHECCVRFQSSAFADIINFEIAKGADVVQLDTGFIKPTWFRIISTRVFVEKVKTVRVMGRTEEDSDASQLNVCIRVQRNVNMFKFKIVLPLGACSFIVILAPLLGGWLLQTVFRLTGLVALIVCFFLGGNWVVNIGTHAPKYMLIYDFYIWTTSLSLITTLLFWGLSKRTYTLPPPHQLKRLANLINPKFPWTSDGKKASVVLEEKEEEEENKEAISPMSLQREEPSEDWPEILRGLNNLSLILFTLVYALGSLVIAVG